MHHYKGYLRVLQVVILPYIEGRVDLLIGKPYLPNSK